MVQVIGDMTANLVLSGENISSDLQIISSDLQITREEISMAYYLEELASILDAADRNEVTPSLQGRLTVLQQKIDLLQSLLDQL